MDDFKPKTIEPIKKVEEKKEDNSDANKGTSSDTFSLPKFKLASFFAEDLAVGDMDSIEKIYVEFKNQGIVNSSDMIAWCRKLEDKIKFPPVGISRVRHFLNYFKMFLLTSDLKKELNAYERQQKFH